MKLLEMSPEQINLAFLCLQKKAQPSKELLELPEETWVELGNLLEALQIEKSYSTIN